ncbi:hypothetical protein MKW98_012623 [Papaver atlanticum]|uniref:Uncharacterized protein n=1 Tax=Papaver atlanticum TaxID=357466 RepID=A0AAD4T2F0_9MAGN|nr:hypothetical protein MKW98_012623 [Papaver atlanticum]
MARMTSNDLLKNIKKQHACHLEKVQKKEPYISPLFFKLKRHLMGQLRRSNHKAHERTAESLQQSNQRHSDADAAT